MSIPDRRRVLERALERAMSSGERKERGESVRGGRIYTANALALWNLKMMTDNCPYCGGKVPRRLVGRPKLDVDVQNVLHALSEGFTVAAVAHQFGISRSSVYRMRERPLRTGQ